MFFFSSRRRHTRSVSAFLLNRSSDLNSSRTSEAALWPSTYISPLSNSTPCIRKDRISSKSLMRLSICFFELNALHTKRQNLFQELDAVIHLLRSEERRVGKESKSRWE